ncbi:MAG: hypothetical protein EP343_22430 [Deltaproteobacteria bacterium]|nr:MAG: hypothetical protein EP343_22430 [Deltaproteobacteria bacterium]
MKKSTTCTSDADCPGGQTCNTSTGQCGTATPGKKLGEECGQTIGDCESGLQCIGTQLWGKFYCFQNCANDAAVCKNGTTCIQASSTISICAKQAAKGEACDYAGATTQALCQAGQKPALYCSPRTKTCTEFKLLKEGDTCGGATDTDPIGICDSDSNLTCSNGKCVTVKTVGKYDPCGGNTAAQCGATETCVSTSQDSGHCFTKCTVSSPQCATGETCQALQQGSSDGVCVPSGNLDYGTACGVEPTEKYNPAKLCKQDLSCVNFGRRICIELASGNCQSYQCKTTGATCVDLSAGSSTFAGCFKPCTADTDCTSETFCRDLQTSGKVCWPKNPPGDVTYGGVCKASAQNQTERCKEPGTCLTTNPESGFCTTQCNADGDCGAAPGGSGLTVTCAPISQTSKLCVFDCSASGATCPTGLQCEDIQGSKLCVPPTPTGPNAFQSKCDRNQPIAQGGCAAGLTCFGTSQQSGDGLCSKTCAQNSECTVGSTTASCVKGLFQDPNVGLCVVPCGQPGQTCPTGLTCQTLGSNSICLP